jgi:hypothetical protein
MDAETDDDRAPAAPSAVSRAPDQDPPAARAAHSAANKSAAAPAKQAASADSTEATSPRADQAPAEADQKRPTAVGKKAAAEDGTKESGDAAKSDPSDEASSDVAATVVLEAAAAAAAAPTPTPVAATVVVAQLLVAAGEAGTEAASSTAAASPIGDAKPAGAEDAPVPPIGPAVDPSAALKDALHSNSAEPQSAPPSSPATAGEIPAAPQIAANAEQAAADASVEPPTTTRAAPSQITPSPAPAHSQASGSGQSQSVSQAQAAVQAQSVLLAQTTQTSNSGTAASESADATNDETSAQPAPSSTGVSTTVAMSANATPPTSNLTSASGYTAQLAAQLAGQDGSTAGDGQGPAAGQAPAPSNTPPATAQPKAADPSVVAFNPETGAVDPDQTAAKPGDPALPAIAAPQPHAVHTQADAAAGVARAEQIAAHPVVEQVTVRMVKAAADGIDRISIALNPPELGHIEVRMEIGPNGHYKAVFAADRPQTADMLQRNAQELTRSLQDAGLSTDMGSLSFNLRGQGQQNNAGHMARNDTGDLKPGVVDVVPEVALPVGVYAGSPNATSRLDIRV